MMSSLDKCCAGERAAEVKRRKAKAKKRENCKCPPERANLSTMQAKPPGKTAQYRWIRNIRVGVVTECAYYLVEGKSGIQR